MTLKNSKNLNQGECAGTKCYSQLRKVIYSVFAHTIDWIAKIKEHLSFFNSKSPKFSRVDVLLYFSLFNFPTWLPWHHVQTHYIIYTRQVHCYSVDFLTHLSNSSTTDLFKGNPDVQFDFLLMPDSSSSFQNLKNVFTKISNLFIPIRMSQSRQTI